MSVPPGGRRSSGGSLAGNAFSLDFAIEIRATGRFGIGIQSMPHDILLAQTVPAPARDLAPSVMSRAVPAVDRGYPPTHGINRPQDERRRLMPPSRLHRTRSGHEWAERLSGSVTRGRRSR